MWHCSKNYQTNHLKFNDKGRYCFTLKIKRGMSCNPRWKNSELYELFLLILSKHKFDCVFIMTMYANRACLEVTYTKMQVLFTQIQCSKWWQKWVNLCHCFIFLFSLYKNVNVLLIEKNLINSVISLTFNFFNEFV